MSVFKNFPVSEQVKVQFRAEFFNAFNTARFNPPAMNVNSAAFAQITGAQRPRVIQLGLRLTF